MAAFQSAIFQSGTLTITYPGGFQEVTENINPRIAHDIVWKVIHSYEEYLQEHQAEKVMMELEARYWEEGF